MEIGGRGREGGCNRGAGNSNSGGVSNRENTLPDRPWGGCALLWRTHTRTHAPRSDGGSDAPDLKGDKGEEEGGTGAIGGVIVVQVALCACVHKGAAVVRILENSGISLKNIRRWEAWRFQRHRERNLNFRQPLYK